MSAEDRRAATRRPRGARPASARPSVPDSVAVVSSRPAQPGFGRPTVWQRLRAVLGLGGMVVFVGVLVAGAVAATLLLLAIVVATAFG